MRTAHIRRARIGPEYAAALHGGHLPAKAATILEIALDDPTTEGVFLRWWKDASALLDERFAARSRELIALGRGHYLAIVEFALPGTWARVEADPRWRELELGRPELTLDVRQGRLWHRGGELGDISTTELGEWMTARAAGELDFVLIDARDRTSYEKGHLPGAINLSIQDVESHANGIIGTSREERIVVYCSGYACPASARVATRLVELGYRGVVEYPGGLEEWQETGGALAQSPPEILDHPLEAAPR